MSGWESLGRVLWVLALGGAIPVVALWLSKAWGRFRHRKPNSLVTHFVMAGLAIAAMGLISGGRWSEFGLGLGSFHWSPMLLLWVLPTAVLTIIQLAVSRGRPSDAPHPLGPVQTVLRVWIVASIAEEVLTRGLVQGLLGPLSTTGFRVGGNLVSVSVLLAAVAFAALHLVLVRKMGVKAAPVIVLAFLLGCVTGVCRQTTGSLVPAVVVHMLFNIGGTIPTWLVPRQTGRPPQTRSLGSLRVRRRLRPRPRSLPVDVGHRLAALKFVGVLARAIVTFLALGSAIGSVARTARAANIVLWSAFTPMFMPPSCPCPCWSFVGGFGRLRRCFPSRR